MERFLKSRYRIGEQLSENPFSVTYKGAFLGNNKPVLIKIYKRGTLNSLLINRMKQKVKELTQLNHPNLARLIDGDYGWQGFYYVREFVDGSSLKQVLARGEAIGFEQALLIAGQAGKMLESAHQRGIIHGAIKPSNIFLDPKGVVKIADFVIEGEIKEAMPQKAITLIDNADYTAPEELTGVKASAASDVYSLGLVLLEMLGNKTAGAGGLAGGLKKIRQGLAHEGLAQQPAYLRDIIDKSLQRDPLLRFGSMADFCFSLENRGIPDRKAPNAEFAAIFDSTVTQYGGEELTPESESLEEVGQVKLRWGKEKHRRWILVAVLALALVSGLIYAFLFGR